MPVRQRPRRRRSLGVTGERAARRARPFGVRARCRDDGGLTSLELAIIFPVILLVILLMFQISLYWHTANAVGVAAEQGLHAGQVFPENDGKAELEADAAVNAILSSSVNLQVPPTVLVTRVDGGERLRVSVTAWSPRLVGIGTWRVRSVAEGRFEEFVSADDR